MDTLNNIKKINTLLKLDKYLKNNEESIINLVKSNSNLSDKEIYLTGIYYLRKEIKYLISNLKFQNKKSNIKLGNLNERALALRTSIPKGNVLIVTENNDYFNIFTLVIYSFINDNKTSIYFVNKHIIFDYFKNILKAIFEDGVTILEELTLKNSSYDFIYYAGFEENGKNINKFASSNNIEIYNDYYKNDLCIIDKDIDVLSVCKKIVWSKLLNLGQTNKSVLDLYVDKYNKFEVVKTLKKLFSEKYNNEFLDESYPYIISEVGFNNLVSYLKNNEILYGGRYNSVTHQVVPTIVSNAKENDSFFGPVLNIIEYNNLDEILEKVKRKDQIYYFSNNKVNIEKLLSVYNKNLMINDLSVDKLDWVYNYYQYKDVFNNKRIFIKKDDKLFNDLRTNDENYKKFKKYFN